MLGSGYWGIEKQKKKQKKKEMAHSETSAEVKDILFLTGRVTQEKEKLRGLSRKSETESREPNTGQGTTTMTSSRWRVVVAMGLLELITNLLVFWIIAVRSDDLARCIVLNERLVRRILRHGGEGLHLIRQTSKEKNMEWMTSELF